MSGADDLLDAARVINANGKSVDNVIISANSASARDIVTVLAKADELNLPKNIIVESSATVESINKAAATGQLLNNPATKFVIKGEDLTDLANMKPEDIITAAKKGDIDKIVVNYSKNLSTKDDAVEFFHKLHGRSPDASEIDKTLNLLNKEKAANIAAAEKNLDLLKIYGREKGVEIFTDVVKTEKVTGDPSIVARNLNLVGDKGSDVIDTVKDMGGPVITIDGSIPVAVTRGTQTGSVPATFTVVDGSTKIVPTLGLNPTSLMASTEVQTEPIQTGITDQFGLPYSEQDIEIASPGLATAEPETSEIIEMAPPMVITDDTTSFASIMAAQAEANAARDRL